MPILIFIAFLAVVLLYFVMIYNNLVQLKHNVAKAWSNIDVLLKQRHDELPKLVDTCKQYMQFEQTTLEKVMAARAGVALAREAKNMMALGAAESALRSGIGNLIATVEAYPELKANDQFQHLLGRITGLEDAIADRREYYNETVNINNVRIEQFPDTLIAHLFRFYGFESLQFSEEDRKDVAVGTLFKQ